LYFDSTGKREKKGVNFRREMRSNEEERKEAQT